MRRGALLALLLALAGCSSEGPTGLGRIGLLAYESLAGDAPPAPAPTRADLEATGAAILAVSAEGAPPGYVAALADSGGFVTYQDAEGRALVLRGGGIARTHGFGRDLRAVRSERGDPVYHPRPLAAWPGQATREYQYRVRDGRGYSIVLACRFEAGARRFVEILGRRHEVVEIAETCANPRRQVENRHWVDPETGRLWRTRQWIGPEEPALTLETVVPYAPAPRW